ncbi:pectinesterase [Echria macrotheca]|uniref:Pectinesterase n=1 Tax=Echria macrotheca TaxID=438768 RepID=A0AAJ0FDR7_9PEZI|nr:pectinesterase [Echria macrotheca]
MRRLSSIFALLALTPASQAIDRTTPPPSCLVVSKSSGSQYKTISAAVSALSLSTTSPQCIFISPGTYKEQILLPPSLRSSLTIYGSTPDTSTYKSNTVTITSSKSQADGLSNDESATLRIKSPGGVKVYNIDIENGYGKGSQAVAVSVEVDAGFYGVSLRGYQDTVLVNLGRQVFGGCEVVGATDFVFGRRGSAWFEKCDIHVVSASLGYITASGRQSTSDPTYYVFNNCSVAAAPGQSVPNGAYYLGRPWAAYARVVFQRTDMSSVINPAGWRIWNSGDERTGNVMFAEYGNTGPGAQGTRASFATKLSAPVTMDAVLGSGYANAVWFDASYLR